MITNIDGRSKSSSRKERLVAVGKNIVYLLKSKDGLYLQRDGSFDADTFNAVYFDTKEDARRYISIKDLLELSLVKDIVKNLDLKEKKYRVIKKDYYNILTGSSKIVSENLEKKEALELSKKLNEKNNIKYFGYIIIDEFTLPYDGISEFLEKNTYNKNISV